MNQEDPRSASIAVINMDEDDLILPGLSGDSPSQESTSGRPWTVKMLEQIQGFLQSDKARYYILKIMVDGEWHNLTSLLRVAKKYRPIGLVGVGMALNSLQASIGCDIFENETEHESSAADIVDSSWKIKDDYMGILRAVVSSMDGSPSPAEQTSKLTSTLERMQLQKAARAGQPGTESQ